MVLNIIIIIIIIIIISRQKSVVFVIIESECTITINTKIYWFLLIQITLLNVSTRFLINLKPEYYKK